MRYSEVAPADLPFRRGEAPTTVEFDIDGGSAEGYVVDTMAEQVSNWLYRNDADPELAEHIREYRRVAFLNNINVEEESQGKGVGRELLDGFVDEAAEHEAEAVYLVADSGEDQREGFNLVDWYERYGFDKIADTPSGPVMEMILI